MIKLGPAGFSILGCPRLLCGRELLDYFVLYFFRGLSSLSTPLV